MPCHRKHPAPVPSSGSQGIEARVTPAAPRPKASPRLLRALFLHHDGIVLGPTVAALRARGLLDALLTAGRMSVADMLRGFPASPGYLHVALRCLASQGWLHRHGAPGSDTMVYEVTDRGRAAAAAFPVYAEVADVAYRDFPLDPFLFRNSAHAGADFGPFEELIERCVAGWRLAGPLADATAGTVGEAVRRHLDGMLAAPTMITLTRRGLFDARDGIDLDDEVWQTKGRAAVLRLLAHLGWADTDATRPRLTPLGREARDYSLHYGLTWSYYPMMRGLQHLIFRSQRNVTHVNPGERETHVDRVLNVLASGVAHRPYFEDADQLVIELFNREPVEAQPLFVADMGCGDGAWLARIYETVRTHTRRGSVLSDHPLLMVGADYNVEAQQVARERLTAAGVPNLVLFGDVSDPAMLESMLREHGLEIRDGLHVRAFIDHNRPWRSPSPPPVAAARSTGAFADETGAVVPNAALESELREHLAKWVPFVERHGLIIIEAHDVDPQVAHRYLGRTHATAFDTYHGYSNQYPVDYSAFAVAAEEAGLCSVIHQQELYPTRLPFVAISLNRFLPRSAMALPGQGAPVERGAAQWRPSGDEDLADGEALHRLLYAHGDLTLPKGWGLRATGLVVRWALTAVRRAIEEAAGRSGAERRVVVADYGAGTGLAAIELIKAMVDRGLLAECERRGVRFVLALLDLPGGWFAQSYQLLGHLPYVEFYSLKDPETGRIRMMTEIFGGKAVDVVIASMVFHLIPPRVMPRLMEDFAGALRAGGELLWSTPDTGPALPGGSVIHDPNRALRRSFLRMLDEPGAWEEFCAALPEEAQSDAQALTAVLADLRERLRPGDRAACAQAAGRQILPRSTDVGVISTAITPHFTGTMGNHLCIMPAEDAMALALLPANQRNVCEIDQRDARERMIRVLMRHAVLPEFMAGPAGCAEGYHLHWTLGRHAVRDS